MTFRACSSPAQPPVKSQPAPAILSQELVHTTLSITHHTRKRPPPVLEPHMVLTGASYPRRHVASRLPGPRRLLDGHTPKAEAIICSPRPELLENAFPLVLVLARAPGQTPRRASHRRAQCASAIAPSAIIPFPSV
jgi:hypothetical protein